MLSPISLLVANAKFVNIPLTCHVTTADHDIYIFFTISFITDTQSLSMSQEYLQS